ncbi:uncharacterized protein LOC126737249 [Anthonomus grandis grandis]|uniref:uncharacterized protein LOC126737249 n=1 Tax=Anthonomus grandis grandis TaxID=2921223 RepID=UPI0021660E4E|nr:uncharacterized protein LOC126737249 [Anthonomus grandis grandis]
MCDNIDYDGSQSDKSGGENSEKRQSRGNAKQIKERVRKRPPSSSSSTSSSDSESEYVSRKQKKTKIEEIISKKVHAIIKKMQIPGNAPLNNAVVIPQNSPGSSENFSHCELVPNFDPEAGDINAVTWINKIEQLALIYSWTDLKKSYFLQAKLTGMAKIWYNGLSDYNKTWDEWKEAILNAFPSHAYFVDNLKKMLNRKKLAKESMLHYYYSKCMLIRNCDISDTNAVSCIIDGLPPEHQGTAKSANFKTPDELFRGFLCKLDKEGPEKIEINGQIFKKENIVCPICKKPGHQARNCYFNKETNKAGPSSDKTPYDRRATKQYTHCQKLGHLREDCWHLKSSKVHLLKRENKRKSRTTKK